MRRPVIERVLAREVLNFRGNPTVETEVVLVDGCRGLAAAPSGISTGSAEALQLLDGDSQRFDGKGVRAAVENVRSVIDPALRGVELSRQVDLDRILLKLDSTPTKRILGGNATLSVSIAGARAAAASRGENVFEYLGEGPYRLPRIWYNMFGGGVHANRSTDLQEYLVSPSTSFSLWQSLEFGIRIYRALRDKIEERGLPVHEGGGGALSAPVRSNEEPLHLIAAAIEAAGYRTGEDYTFGIDAAASHLYRDGRYCFSLDSTTRSREEMVLYWEKLTADYDIRCLEDPMAEDDWEGWQALTERIGERTQLVGDDLFTTNPARVRKGVEIRAANAALIKPNQVGTVTEALDAMAIAQGAGWQCMLSTRSGETEDTLVADLSVLPTGGQIKTGPPWKQVVTKHNRLLRIEDSLSCVSGISCEAARQEF